MNSINLLGNICNNINIKTSDNGTIYAYINLAISDGKRTTFVLLTAFGSTAQFINKYFAKGQSIAVNAHFTGGERERDFKNSIVIDSAYFTGQKHNNDFANIVQDENVPFPE